MERKVGEIFTYNGKTYQVVESNICIDCAFNCMICGLLVSFTGNCNNFIAGRRTDKTNIIFKEIKGMENNQLNIKIPEGFKIDLENSDLSKGIIKFKKKDITYDDILQAYATDFGGIRVPNHCIDKVLAISQLMNITKYYNGDWKYKVNGGERGYMIAYDNSIKELPYYKVNVINPTTDVYYGNPIFENDVDAQAVIDNPNFRDILDTIYKN